MRPESVFSNKNQRGELQHRETILVFKYKHKKVHAFSIFAQRFTDSFTIIKHIHKHKIPHKVHQMQQQQYSTHGLNAFKETEKCMLYIDTNRYTIGINDLVSLLYLNCRNAISGLIRAVNECKRLCCECCLCKNIIVSSCLLFATSFFFIHFC